MAYVYFIGSVIMLFSESGGQFEIITNNIIMVLDFIFAFCGLSFIESKFKEKLRYGIIRGLIYAVVFFIASSFAIQILSLIGLLDSFADYRGTRKIGE